MFKAFYFIAYSDAVRFAFGPIVQQELDIYKEEWNNHYIRHSSMAELPHGVPDVLYYFPELKGEVHAHMKMQHGCGKL